MDYSKGRASALKMFRECGIVDPTVYKLSDIVIGRGATVRLGDLAHSDGRIVFGDRNALITVSSKIKRTERQRFVLAHEFGHYEMHRDSFIQHDDDESTLHYFQKGTQEKEANDFANEILMPSEIFRQFCRGEHFSPDLLRACAEKFKVSVTSSAYRFREFGNHPIMIVYSIGGRVEYWKGSSDFPYRLRSLKGIPVPENSVAQEYFRGKKIYRKNESKQSIRKSTWFNLSWDQRDGTAFEYCICSDWNKSVLSVIWEE